MHGLRNRRSSLSETRSSTSLYRGQSDFSAISALAGSTPKSYGSLRRESTDLSNTSSLRTSSSSNSSGLRLGRTRSTSTERTFQFKDKSAERDTLLRRSPGRRSSSSSDYRIGAHRTPSSRETSLEEIESRLSRLSSFCSREDSRPPSMASGGKPLSQSRFSSSVLTEQLPVVRATSSSSSFGSTRDIPPYLPQSDEPATRLNSLKRSLSGRLSGSLLSPSSRPSPTKSIKAEDSTDGSPRSSRKGGGLCGLRNVGNSCYQNAVLQLLRSIPEFFQCFVGLQKSTRIAGAMRQLLSDMSRSTANSPVDAASLRRSLGRLDCKWDGYGQEDAHEFLTEIISALQEDCNRNIAKPRYRELEDRDSVRIQAMEEWKYSKQWNDSEIDDLFGFQLHNQITCPSCKHKLNRFGYLTSLEIPLPETATSLQECLHSFAEAEILDRENVWLCPRCQAHVQAVQQLSLSRLPKVLLVCLKRFGSNKNRFLSFHSWKNNVCVHLPRDNTCLKHILSPIVDAQTTKGVEYEIISIVDHSGSVNFGHYTARVKDRDKNNWYLINDENVRQIESPFGPSGSAYILALRQVEQS